MLGDICFSVTGWARMERIQKQLCYEHLAATSQSPLWWLSWHLLLKAPKGRRIMRPCFHGLYLYWKWTWADLLPLCSMGAFCPHWAPSGHPHQAVTAVPPQAHPQPALSLQQVPPGTCQGPGRSKGQQLLSFHWRSEKTIRMKEALKKEPLLSFSMFHWLPAPVQGCFSLSVDLGMYRGES